MKFFTKISLVFLIPLFAFAAEPDLGWFEELISQIGDIVGAMIPVAIAIGLLYFIWGLVQYIANSGDDGARQEGKNKMIWGIVALFVMVAVWGIVTLLGDILNVDVGKQLNQLPTINGIGD